MHRTRIKICGVRTPEAALAAAEAGADAIGFVFAAGSPREVTLEEAEAVVAALPAMVEPVGLFVDAPPERIRETCRRLHLRTVQLHGRETPRDAEALAPLRVIKALAFDGGDAAEAVRRWRDGCRGLAGVLFDAPPPPGHSGTELTGGHGRSFDWAELTQVARSFAPGSECWPPLILAGGLTPFNVAEAIAAVGPYAVDVSSGVESSRGVKDPQRIAAFCRAVREADASALG